MHGYFYMDLILWLITVIVMTWSWKRISLDWKWSTIITCVIVMVLQTFNEWLSFNIFKAWGFSQDYNKFIGIDFLGAPIEEHLFWFAFAWMIPFLYAGIIARMEKKT